MFLKVVIATAVSKDTFRDPQNSHFFILSFASLNLDIIATCFDCLFSLCDSCGDAAVKESSKLVQGGRSLIVYLSP